MPLARSVLFAALSLGAAAPSAFPQCATRLGPSPGSSGGGFGHAIDVSHDTLVVGAPSNSEQGGSRGVVHVYEWDGTDWVASAVLRPTVGSGPLQFGLSVALHAERLMVGAPKRMGGVPGWVHAFERMGSQWGFLGRLSPSDGRPGDWFGDAVAISGSRALVGAPRHDTGGAPGAAYFFERTPAGWVETQKVDGEALAIALHGSTAVLGSGNTRVYELTSTGWELVQILETPGMGLLGGASVDLDGSTLVCGTPIARVPGVSGEAGSALVFELEGGVWRRVARLTAPDAAHGDSFGQSVVVEGNRIVVGAAFDGASHGSAHVFDRTASGWAHVARLGDMPATVNDQFGTAVTLLGRRPVIGEPGGGTGGAVVTFGCFDCNGNGVSDADEIAAGTATDCNDNGIPDDCDLDLGSEDCNANAVLDECELLGAAFCPCGVHPSCGTTSNVGGCPNSVGPGSGGRVQGCGTGSVAADDLILTATHLPADAPGLWFMGPLRGAPVAFGDGVRCVFGGIRRYAVQSAGGAGTVALGPGIVATSRQRFGPAGRIGAGETWHFQFWYRDAASACGSGLNLSNAFEATFTP